MQLLLQLLPPRPSSFLFTAPSSSLLLSFSYIFVVYYAFVFYRCFLADSCCALTCCPSTSYNYPSRSANIYSPCAFVIEVIIDIVIRFGIYLYILAVFGSRHHTKAFRGCICMLKGHAKVGRQQKIMVIRRKDAMVYFCTQHQSYVVWFAVNMDRDF